MIYSLARLIYHQNVILAHFLCSLLCFQSLAFSASRSSGLNTGLMKPPTDIIQGDGKGRGGEYGIRQLSVEESRSTLEQWRKSLGFITGDDKLELFDILLTLEKVVNVMPGKMPQRYEFLVFGEFVDGKVESISACYCGKVTCPWELDILLVAQHPTYTYEMTKSMVEFLLALCKENAILPEFKPIDKYSMSATIQKILADYSNPSNSILPSSKTSNNMTKVSKLPSMALEELSVSYQYANKARMFCLDSIPNLSLGPYWYQMMIPHTQDKSVYTTIYFRQQRYSLSDFEFRFIRPITGTESGSGTVGGALVLSEERALQVVPETSVDYFASLKNEITAKIIHPDLGSLKLWVRPWRV